MALRDIFRYLKKGLSKCFYSDWGKSQYCVLNKSSVPLKTYVLAHTCMHTHVMNLYIEVTCMSCITCSVLQELIDKYTT